MSVKLLRPPHGWRALVWEIGVVFVGIVLVLAAERLVQQYNWQQDGRQASAAIQAELSEHQIDAVERLSVQRCLKDQLKALSDKLSVHRGGQWAGMQMAVAPVGVNVATQPMLPQAYRAPDRSWLDEAWQIARSNGALNHLPASVISKYAEVYARGYRMLRFQTDEKLAAARLSALAVDGPIDPQSRVELLGALAQADNANSYMERAARQQLEFLRPLLDKLPRDPVDKAIAERMAVQRKLRGSCVQSIKLSRS